MSAWNPPAPSAPAPASAPFGDHLKAAFRFTMKAVSVAPAALFVPSTIFFVIVAFFGIAFFVVGMAAAWIMLRDGAVTTGPVAMLVGAFALSLLIFPIGALWTAGCCRTAYLLIDGERPRIKDGFTGSGRQILTSLFDSFLVSAAMLFFYIPGLVLSVILTWALPESTRGAGTVESMRRSYQLTRSNLGYTIGTMAISGVIGSIAGPLMMLALPVSFLFMCAMHAQLTGHTLPYVDSANTPGPTPSDPKLPGPNAPGDAPSGTTHTGHTDYPSLAPKQ